MGVTRVVKNGKVSYRVRTFKNNKAQSHGQFKSKFLAEQAYSIAIIEAKRVVPKIDLKTDGQIKPRPPMVYERKMVYETTKMEDIFVDEGEYIPNKITVPPKSDRKPFRGNIWDLPPEKPNWVKRLIKLVRLS